MKVTITPAPTLDMPAFTIETGAVYDFPQVVKANLEETIQEEGSTAVTLIWSIVDDSRCMYEKVATVVNWTRIKACQSNHRVAIDQMAGRIMREYLESRFV